MRFFIILSTLLILSSSLVWADNSSDFLYEEFDSLKNWDYITFPLVKKESDYVIINEDGRAILKTSSHNSASSLQYKRQFNVYEYPYVEWSWKVDNVFKDGDVTKKSGDDYPLRVYVVFEYIEEEASATWKFKYNFVKRVYGLLLPHSTLNYIWANRKQAKQVLDNPFEPETSKILILRYDVKELGQWKREEINIIEDYEKAFGRKPPQKATVAIMNDSDNTGEKAISYIDYIRVYNK